MVHLYCRQTEMDLYRLNTKERFTLLQIIGIAAPAALEVLYESNS